MDDTLIVDTITTNLVDLISMISTLVEHLKGKHDRRDRLCELHPELRAVGGHRGLFGDQGGAAFLRAVTAFPAKECGHPRATDLAAPGSGRSHEQPRGRTGDAAGDEILVDRARPFSGNTGPNKHALVNGFNQEAMALLAVPGPIMSALCHKRL